jgi:hypothetical protein
VEKLRKKFGVKLEVLPIPSGADFRVQMSAEEQARVSREIDANVRESLMRGTEDLWKRLREVVAHMVDRLNEPESRFHGSLVTNVLDLVEILPRLNVNGDTDLICTDDPLDAGHSTYHGCKRRRQYTAARGENVVGDLEVNFIDFGFKRPSHHMEVLHMAYGDLVSHGAPRHKTELCAGVEQCLREPICRL